ncbi:hypothetical protein ES703_46886 [subsurface metagenome]
MAEDTLKLIQENVVQGRVTQEDEGLDEGMVGQPGVSELVETALAQGISVQDIINKGLTAGMEIVGQKFEAKEYFIPDMLASAEAVGGSYGDAGAPHGKEWHQGQGQDSRGHGERRPARHR